MWKALVLVVKSTTSLGRPYYPPGSAIYFDFSLSRCCITLFWGFLSNKNLVFTSCGRLFHHIFKIFLLKYGDFLLVYHNLILKLRLIASQRSNRHHLKMRCPNGGPFLSLNFSKKDSIFFFCQLAGTMKITIYMVIFRSKKKSNAIQVLTPDRKFAMELRISVHWCATWRLGAST